MMNEEDLFRIRDLVKENPTKTVLAVIKGGHVFVTDLSDLDLTNAISILFMNDAFKNVENQTTLSKFDVVLWFKGVKSWTGDKKAHLDSFDYPDLRLWIGQLCQLVDANCIRLVSMEEQFLRFAAETRNMYNIPGPKSNEIDQFCDKIEMKNFAKSNGIRTANYTILKAGDIQFENNFLELLEETLSYPFFFKPIHGCGAAGTAKIDDRQALIDWSYKHADDETMLIAEEFIQGEEIHILGFYQNGTVKFFPSTLRRWPMTIYDFINTGKPMPVYDGGSKAEKEKMFEFGRKVVAAFPQMEGNLLFIQFFDTPNGFILNEIACRPPGVTGSTTFYQNSGINPEVVQIMGQIKTIDIEEFVKPMPHFGMICYPMRQMKNVNLVNIPKNGISSTYIGRWLVKPGQDLWKATNVGDLVMRIYLWNTDYSQLLHDMEFLRNHYDPINITEQ